VTESSDDRGIDPMMCTTCYARQESALFWMGQRCC